MIIVLCGILAFVYLAFVNNGEFNQELKINNISICYGVNADNYYKSDNCKSNFTKNEINDLYVCGYVDAKFSDIKNLSIVVTSNQAAEPFFANPANDRFGIGHFCRKITLPHNDRIGTYKVDFYYSREIVATIKFATR